MELRRVVVTGLGALTPIGNNIQEYWDGLTSGRSGAAPITYYDTEKHKTKFACEVKGFNIEDRKVRKPRTVCFIKFTPPRLQKCFMRRIYS